jgi:hypothetical protein
MTLSLAYRQPIRAALAHHGLPADRRATLAARRAFVQLKQTFLQAIDSSPAPRADWLRQQVRAAEEPADLWQLRTAVFDALPAHGSQRTRAALQRDIDSTFPLSDLDSVFTCW